jgi:hypothetical protein
MRTVLLGAIGLLLTICLVGCDFVKGVDHDFGVEAEAVFIEIDDDTMEMELSDTDDVGEFNLLSYEAESEREMAFINEMEKMLNLQEKVVDGDIEALKEYLTARESALEAIGLGDDYEGWHSVPAFEFTKD